MKFFWAILPLVGFLSVPLPIAAEISQTEIATIEAQARRDAEIEGDEKFWALATFAGNAFLGPYFSVPALGGAYYYQPDPPAHRFIDNPTLLHKEIYTSTYKSVYRRSAIRGVIIGALGGAALYYYRRQYGFNFFYTW
ncbi:MAG: hypothetical protein OXN25_17030 [Candidatus Poribacteria bacterium]|nr:hypothetical protein [Candidatus Poribacteria bacterium]MYK18082.1 hypothetical protein [Candidatus Poribacteria bacterium]